MAGDISFIDRTGIFSSKKKIICSVLTVCVLLAIIVVCIYQLVAPSDHDDSIAQYDKIKRGIASHNARKQIIEDVRLPTHLKPEYYRISLIPHLNPSQNFSIDGTVKILMSCQNATDKIILNIKNITIIEDSVNVTNEDNEALSIVGHEYDVERDFYKVLLTDELEQSETYTISLNYKGTLNDQLVGFYRSSYVDTGTNETRWIGVTQFSPTDARRAYPSFDEPAFKATFEISIGRLENMTSLSNMQITKTEPIPNNPGYVMDFYEKTLPMSTYLTGFAVTDFISRESNFTDKPKYQIWSRRDAIDQTDYARNIGPKILAYFEQYFNISFPLPKIDTIAVSDHRFNAMENWGMITYRELVILNDPINTADADRRRIAEVVGHELAHQWFGNLVTPAWWSDLWLKEGFASYIEYLGIEQVEPEWEILNIFVTNELQKVYRKDALNNSHQISIPVNNPSEINEIFDDISYAKGCTIIRMMDHFLTQSTFKQGLTNYLNKYKFSNAIQDNLWESLTEQAHSDGTLDPSITVKDIMDTWTLQKGFPVVHVERNYMNASAIFNQSKFRLQNDDGGEEFEDFKWTIAMSYASPSYNIDFKSTKPEFWVLKNESSVQKSLEEKVNSDQWIVVNVQTTGYYRVNYDLRNWKLIDQQLKSDPSKIHVVNRAELMDDSLTLSRAGLLEYPITLNLTQYLKSEQAFLPWESYFENIKYLSDMFLKHEDAFTLFKEYVKSQISTEFNRLGFMESPEEPILQKAHRVHILRWACGIGLSECINNATTLFANWMESVKNQNSKRKDAIIPVNLREAVYCNGIKHGNIEEWNFAKEQYIISNVASEKNRILKSLACSRDSEILSQYLNDAITIDSYVRKQDSRNVIQWISDANEIGNSLAFQFLQTEWNRISEYFGPGLSIARIINEGVAVKLNTISDLSQMVQFRADHDGQFGSGARAVDEAIEIIQKNIYWMENLYSHVLIWLQENFKKTN